MNAVHVSGRVSGCGPNIRWTDAGKPETSAGAIPAGHAVSGRALRLANQHNDPSLAIDRRPDVANWLHRESR
jgi:hypothetical protein